MKKINKNNNYYYNNNNNLQLLKYNKIIKLIN